MRYLILTTAALLSLASAGAAMAARPQVVLPELAASGMPQPQTDQPGNVYAASGMPQSNTTERATQLAFGQHPEAVTNAHATQLAAFGMDGGQTA